MLRDFLKMFTMHSFILHLLILIHIKKTINIIIQLLINTKIYLRNIINNYIKLIVRN